MTTGCCAASITLDDRFVDMASLEGKGLEPGGGKAEDRESQERVVPAGSPWALVVARIHPPSSPFMRENTAWAGLGYSAGIAGMVLGVHRTAKKCRMYGIECALRMWLQVPCQVERAR